MKHSFAIAAALAALFAAVGGASAEDWGPFPVKIPNGDTETVGQFVPLKAAEKRWKLCALVPHVKDSYWIAADYGLIEEAKRLGVDIAVFEAGGYGNLPRQVNQFDDCLASKADAILVAPISEAGLAGSFAKAKAAKVPTIAFINPVSEAPVAGKIFTQMKTKGVEAGRFLVKTITQGGPGYQVVGFPGAQGSGWAEQAVDGFKVGIEGSPIRLLDTKFGDTGVSDQLTLVEDALQTYPQMNLIWGTAPTVEAAIGAVADANRPDIHIMAEYGTREMLDLLRKKKIMGFVSDYTVVQARMAVDLAVMVLEGKTPGATAFDVEPTLITDPSVSLDNVLQHFAPEDWQPVFTSK